MDIQIRPSETISVADATTVNTDGTPNTGQFSYLIGYRTNPDAANANATLTKDFTVPASNPGSVNIRIKPQGWDSAVNGNVAQYDFVRVRLLDPANSAVLLDIAGPQLSNYATCPFSPNYRIAAITNTTPGYGLYNYWDNGRNSDNHTLGMSAAYNRGLQPWTNCSVSLATVAGRSVRLEIRTDIFNQYRTWFLIDDVEWSVVNATLGAPERRLDHIRLVHDGAGVTCMTESVTVRACADTACATLTTTPVTVGLAASGGGTFSSNPITFTGSATVQLAKTTAGDSDLSVISASPAPTATPIFQCAGGAVGTPCRVNFANSGLVFTNASGTPHNFAHQLSYKPFSQTSGVDPGVGTGDTYGLLAVRTDTNTGVCGAAVTGTRAVSFGVTCVNPASCATSNPLNINGAPYTAPINLTFDAGGLATFSNVGYRDAGQVRLTASTTGTVGGQSITIAGQSNAFTIKPVGFCVRPGTTGATLNDCSVNPTTSCAAGPRAGETFSLRVAGVGWEMVSDSDLCSQVDARPVANFIGHTATLSGLWAGTDASLSAPSLGTTTAPIGAGGGVQVNNTVDNVGIFRFQANLTDYLGAGAVSGQSTPLGRFWADHFANVSAGTLVHACSSTFTYLGQDGVEVRDFKFEARGLGGAAPLSNYHGVYAKLDLASFGAYAFTATGLPAGVGLGASATPPSGSWANGTATATTRLFFSRPTTGPVTQSGAVAVQIKPADTDGATLPAATTLATLPAQGLRFGILRLDNAYGSELLPIRVPVRALYWDTNRWRTNTDDTCTNIGPGTVQIGSVVQAAGSALAFAAPPAGVGVTQMSPSSPGMATLIVTPSARGVGSADLRLNLGGSVGTTGCGTIASPQGGAAPATSLAHLAGNWCGSDYGRAPTARIRFGSPKAPYIYLRERY